MKNILQMISLLALGGTLLGMGGVQAQNSDTPVIYIYGSINENPVSDEFEPGQSNYSPELYTGLRDLLREEGFDPVFVRASDSPLYPEFFEPQSDHEYQDDFWRQATLVSATSYDDSDAVTASQFAGFQFPPLPAGPFGMTPIAMITPDRPTSLDETIRMAAGVALFTGQHCDRALRYLVKASENEPFTADGVILYPGMMFYRAGCAYLQGNVARAVDFYQTVIDYDYGLGDVDTRVFSDCAAINLAWLYLEQEQPASALALLDDYAQLQFSYYTAREMERYLERAKLYMRLDEPARALAELDRLILIARDVSDEAGTFDLGNEGEFTADELARLYTERGVLYWETGDYETAQADFNTALETDDTYPKAYYWRGVLAFDQGNDQAALADLEQFQTLTMAYSHVYEEPLAPLIASAQTYILKIEARAP